MTAARRLANCALASKLNSLYRRTSSCCKELNRHSIGAYRSRPAWGPTEMSSRATTADQELIRRLKRMFFKDGNGGKRRLALELRRIADLCELTSQPRPKEDKATEEAEAEDDDVNSSGMQKRVIGAVGHSGTLNGTPASSTPPSRRKGKRQRGRPFDVSMYRSRFVALKISYVGWKYHGYACQEHNDNTIEEYFFRALRLCKLISETANFKDLKYSRCGRTDKGVSALGQVVALRVRSQAKLGEPEASVEEEIDYPKVINAVLPKEIRVVGWTQVPDSFDARFSATYRVYKYFLVSHDYAPLDIDAMREAAVMFLGSHDLRNFCKLDVRQTTQYIRRMDECSIEEVEGVSVPDGRMYVLTTKGSSYLWHQIRCMMSVLFMVGRGREKPEIVKDLLDIKTVESKPQYNMASEVPLLLHECGFNIDLEFIHSGSAMEQVLLDTQEILDTHCIGCGFLTEMMAAVKTSKTTTPMRLPKIHRHIPMLKRTRESSVGERIVKRQQKIGLLI